MSELTEEHISNRNPDQEEVNSSNTQTFPGNIIHSNFPTIDKEHNTSLDESEEVEFFAEGFTESVVDKESEVSKATLQQFVQSLDDEVLKLKAQNKEQRERIRQQGEALRQQQEALRQQQEAFQIFFRFTVDR